MPNPESAGSVPEHSAVQPAATEPRIAWLALVLGFAAAAAAGLAGYRQWGMGLVFGTVLSWLNFRLLRRGMDALVASSIEQGRASRVSPITLLLAMLRYGLLGMCIYVIFERLRIPLGSMLVGLCAVGAATIAASVYEILRPGG